MKKLIRYIGLVLSAGVMFTLSCKEPYNPPVINQPHNYLVVDGFINSGGPITDIILSHTRNLGDTTSFAPELGAVVTLAGQTGELFRLSEIGGGHYVIDSLKLDSTKNYSLQITTSNGKQYASDFVPVKITPPIDSLNWSRDNDLIVSVSTHDPANNTRYYRWDYDETWEYNAYFETDLAYDYNTQQIIFRTPDEYTYRCWQSDYNGQTTIGTSAQLSEDIITKLPVAVIPEGSEKVAVRYSIQVRQYALTEDGFEFWQLLKKNSEQLGTLFDPLPSQLIGNIHSLSDPGEPVIGYVSISTVTTSRLFVRRSELPLWNQPVDSVYCMERIVPNIPDSIRKWMADPTLTPAYYGQGGGIVGITKKDCVFCQLRGGTLVKPPFW